MVETTSRRVTGPMRRSLWLVAGVAVGLALGFAAGLTKPHARR